MATTRDARFEPTRWSLVRRARGEDAAGRAALGELCALYWPPVYAFFRRDGLGPAEARDLTQGLFAELLERGDVAGGDPEAGRFRSYLLACARHYRSNERDRERAQKRGGDRVHTPIVVEPGVGDGVEPVDSDSPDRAYLRAWVRESVTAALTDLQAAEAEQGRGAQFAALRETLVGERAALPYAQLAVTLGTSEAAVKVAVHRLRERFRRALLRRLGATVDRAEDAEAELADLFAALG
jgi:RNA polymerase sigma factor (sigma-70 family)